MPPLPHDVCRMIWQAVWRGEAASMMQRAWRKHALRRAWRRVVYLSRQSWFPYVRKYLMWDDEPARVQPRHVEVAEAQSRSAPHVWTMTVVGMDELD